MPNSTDISTGRKLLWWLIQRDEPLTVKSIVELSGIYPGELPYSQCLEDLKKLEAESHAVCISESGHPHQWQISDYADDRTRFLVIGIYENGQRYADTFDGYSAEHAETQAREKAEESGAELTVAGTVEYEAGTLDDMEIH